MEIKASHFDIATPSIRTHSESSRRARVRDLKTNPRSRKVNRSARADAFQSFSASVLRELNPRSPLESVMADHVVASAWRLKRALQRQTARDLTRTENANQADESPKRISPSAADQAARSTKDALEALDCIRFSRDKYESKTSVDVLEFDRNDHGLESNEWPILPIDASLDDSEDDAMDLLQEAPSWSDRLIFDFDISDLSPVIKGTWITVSHIISLIVDGHTWADILRSHPELTEEDIRLCVAYAVAQDQDED